MSDCRRKKKRKNNYINTTDLYIGKRYFNMFNRALLNQ